MKKVPIVIFDITGTYWYYFTTSTSSSLQLRVGSTVLSTFSDSHTEETTTNEDAGFVALGIVSSLLFLLAKASRVSCLRFETAFAFVELTVDEHYEKVGTEDYSQLTTFVGAVGSIVGDIMGGWVPE